MSRFLARVSPVLLAVALAAPASADVYYVTLTNGTVVESAHQPQQAAWDPSMVLLLTDTGNWVGFPKEQISGVRAEDPTQGFGIKINAKAIALGFSPNDLPPEAKGKDDVNERLYDINSRMLEMAEQQQHYSIQQGVQTEQSQGIPSSFSGTYSGGTSVPIGGLGGGGSVQSPGSSSEQQPQVGASGSELSSPPQVGASDTGISPPQ